MLDWIWDRVGDKLGRQHLMSLQEVHNIRSRSRLYIGAIEKHECVLIKRREPPLQLLQIIVFAFYLANNWLFNVVNTFWFII